MRFLLLLFLISFGCHPAWAQTTATPLSGSAEETITVNVRFQEPLERSATWQYMEFAHRANTDRVFTSIRPFVATEFVTTGGTIETAGESPDLTERLTWPLVILGSKSSCGINVLPVVGIMPGVGMNDSLSSSQYDWYGGLRVRGFYGKNFRIQTTFLAGQQQPVGYLEPFVEEQGILPGIGRANGDGPAYQYTYFTGHAMYQAGKHISLEAGRGKHFWGNGYRSLFLSDVARPMDYAKVTAQIWKLNYTVLYAGMKDIRGVEDSRADWNQKFSTFHHLSINIGKRFNIGLFESVIWQGSDTLVEMGFDPNYLNPVIFFRPVEFSTGSAHNSLIGLDMSFKLTSRTLLYGQALIDEFLVDEFLAAEGSWRNKHAFQLGLRQYQLAGVENLSGLAEFNYVRPYTYTHGSTLQNYGHFNQPIAHPLGANFWESVFMLNYSNAKWQGELKATYSVFGADYAGRNLGGDIYRSYQRREGEINNFTTQGVGQNLLQIALRASYLLFEPSNIRAEARIVQRSFNSIRADQSSTYLELGIRSALFNTYRDF